MDATPELGRLIVEAARLAVAMHLGDVEESTRQTLPPPVARATSERSVGPDRARIGGASRVGARTMRWIRSR